MFLSSLFRMLAVSFLLAFCFNIQVFAKKYTLLVVLTHGDDVVSIAPLLAKSAAEGHTVHYAMFTGIQDTSGVADSPIRKELLCASRVLGFREPFVMSGPAGEAAPTPKAIAERLIEIINQTKPDVIITWGPDGLTGHPRHIMVGNVVTRVFQQQAHLKQKPRKLYYIAYPESLFTETRMPFVTAGVDGPFGTVNDMFITTRVDSSRYIKQTREAIACFTISLGRDDSAQQKWSERVTTTLGGKVFLRLVLPAPRAKEKDIFKGL